LIVGRSSYLFKEVKQIALFAEKYINNYIIEETQIVGLEMIETITIAVRISKTSQK